MFLFLVSSTAINEIVAFYVNWRQYRTFSIPFSDKHKMFHDEDSYVKTIAYNKDVFLYGNVVRIIESIKDLVMYGYLPCLYKSVKKCPYADTAIIIFYMVLMSIPDFFFGLFKDFYIEEKHGFNKKTYFLYVMDYAKMLVLNVILTSIVGQMIVFIVKRYLEFYLYLWMFLTVLSFLILYLYPTFISPMFNKFTPLEDGELKDGIISLARKVGFSADKILVMDGGKRSRHSNAYFTGLGRSKTIVLYDTIIEQLTTEEIIAVLGHEFGHWKHGHNIVFLLMNSIMVFLYSYGMNMVIGKTRKTIPIGLCVLMYYYVVRCVEIPLQLFMNFVRRIAERQADMFAVELGKGSDLASALVKLTAKNKSTPNYDFLYSCFYYMHPHSTERITTINANVKKDE